jgi:hypothetical protein
MGRWMRGVNVRKGCHGWEWENREGRALRQRIGSGALAAGTVRQHRHNVCTRGRHIKGTLQSGDYVGKLSQTAHNS